MTDFDGFLIGQMDLEEIHVSRKRDLHMLERQWDKWDGRRVVVEGQTEGARLPPLIVFRDQIGLRARRT